MMGLLVLLNAHKGSEDVALLADDLDLEIDEILPSLEFAEVLQLVRVADGRATFTDLGRHIVQATIREREAGPSRAAGRRPAAPGPAGGGRCRSGRDRRTDPS